MLFSKMIPVEDMIKLEAWIDENINNSDIASCESDSKLSKKLQLKVEYVNPEKLSKCTEAELAPIDDAAYMGIIRINNRNQHSSFSYMHEIIHYLHDVGRGNRVTQVFERKEKGKTKNDHEQHINYLTAGNIMKYRDIKKALQLYDKSSPKMDEIKFINDLCKKYDQERVAVIRRIREVRKISKAKNS